MWGKHSKPYDRTLFFVPYRCVSLISTVGLLINLQYLSNKVFLLQCLYGVVCTPANLLGNFSMNYMGRRTTQIIFMSVMGISILSITFLTQGEKRTQDEQRKCIHPFSQNFSDPICKKSWERYPMDFCKQSRHLEHIIP